MGESFSLAQKYRPLTFSDVLDQEAIITVLKNLLKNNKFSSPLMFTGIYGGGKTTLARIIARAILCKNSSETGEPCNECSSCLSFLDDSHPAYNEIDAASNSGVDDVRKLREDANFKVLGDYDRKVVVIDECQSISAKGNDALLKQLEDSNTNQVYIFCTTEPEKMHNTVRSRCLEFHLNRNSKESVLNRLKYICEKESISYEEKGLDTIAAMTTPHVRDALKTLEYLSNFGEVTDSIASEHYKLSLENEYLNLVSLLKTDLTGAIHILDNILLQESVSSIYEGIIRNTLGIVKLNSGINTFRTEEQKDLSKVVFDNYGDDLIKVLEELLKRNKYVDQLTLESDIILLNKKLNTTFAKETGVQKVYVEVPTTKVVEKTVEVQAPAIETSVETTPLEKKQDTIPLNETEAVFKRYPTYSPKLAMMMAKSKQNNSSVTDQATVELKKRAKDVKKSLPRSEIRDFIDDRTKRM